MRAFILGLIAISAASIVSAQAQNTVKVAPSVPHPAQSVTVSGTGFGNGEAIDVYLDTADALLLVSSGTGTFSGSLTIPAAATPGVHYVTAIGRHSGDAVQTATTVSTPWSQAGFGNPHLGYNPYENTLNSGNVARLNWLWGAPTGTVYSAPAIVNGRVYTAGADAIHGIQALAVATGSSLWNVATTDTFYASPTIASSVVYIGSIGGTMYAVNAVTGATIWTHSLGSAIESSAAIANGILYVGCTDGKLYALAASTGALIWNYATNLGIYSSPAISGGIVYIGSQDNALYALNATTGVLDWKYQSGNPISATPAIANGRVIFGSDKAYALRAGPSGGQVIWSASLGEEIAESSPAVANGRVFMGTGNGMLYALDPRTGATLWSLNTGGNITHSSPIAAGDVVYLGNDSETILAISASTGTVLASGAASGYVGASAAVSDGVVYFSAEDNRTFALALDAGQQTAVKPAMPRLSDLHPDLSLTATR